MSSVLAVIDPTALRSYSDRTMRLPRSETRLHRPLAYHAGVPEIRAVFLLRTARDADSGQWLITSYTAASGSSPPIHMRGLP